ncbi:MAG: histidinol dehydrogenase [Actinomycetota bacterium]
MLEVVDGRDRTGPVPVPRPSVVHGRSDPYTEARAIVDDVRLRGDEALIEHTARYDDVRLTVERLVVDPAELDRARRLVQPELLEALEVLAARLTSTCERQVPETWTERTGGDLVGELVRPLRRVGAYVPGGRAAYPSTVVMAAVTARVAGVGELAVASPPRPDGELPEAVLAACSVAGVTEVYRVGGAHAIAALAYGTETVRPVDKIVGPGNVYVTAAKQLVRTWVGTDLDAGPTEIAVVADGAAPPAFVAADLLAQAEHGPHGSYVLITWSSELLDAVQEQLALQLGRHRRADAVENALIEGGRAVLVRDAAHALETANAFAPEHLELMFDGAEEALDGVRNAGSVFVGAGSPASVGDYVGGTNHVLPTAGAARWSSGLGAPDFMKRIYVSSFGSATLRELAPHVDALAAAEGLDAHAGAVALRLGAPEGA